MSDDYADAVVQLEAEIDFACSRVLGVLTGKEIAFELRRAADIRENEP